MTIDSETWLSRRLPGAVLIAAFVVFVTGAGIGFLAPSLRDAPPFVTDDVAAVASAIAGNPAAWRWANGLILAAAVITALGLVPISIRFNGASRTWALAGLVSFSMAAVLSVVSRLTGIGVTTWAAQQYPDPTVVAIFEAFRLMHLGSAFMVLAFVAIGLYGMAMTRMGAHGMGWVFVAVGLVGILLEAAGAAIPLFVYLTTAAFGVATWRPVSG